MVMTYGHGGAQQSSLSFEQDSCVDVVVRLMLAMRIVMIVSAHDYCHNVAVAWHAMFVVVFIILHVILLWIILHVVSVRGMMR